MVRFYIVRHGQTLLNSLDRAQGWADSPLTEAGKQMAADIGQKLKGIDFDAVYTSDMLRAVQTAELILEAGEKGGVPIEKDARLREWCLGCKSAGKPVKVLLLIFLCCMAAGCPARPKSPRPNRTWHSVQG